MGLLAESLDLLEVGRPELRVSLAVQKKVDRGLGHAATPGTVGSS